jgi:hypothetical protein
VLVSLAPAFLEGCTVRLISDYDERIDQAASELQKRMDRHVSRVLEGAIPRAYPSSRGFYVDCGLTCAPTSGCGCGSGGGVPVGMTPA